MGAAIAAALVVASAAPGCAGGAEAPRSGRGPAVLSALDLPHASTETAAVRGAGVAEDPMPLRPGTYRVVPDPRYKGGLRVVEERAITDRPGPGPDAKPAPEPPPLEEAPREPPEKPRLIEVPPPH